MMGKIILKILTVSFLLVTVAFGGQWEDEFAAGNKAYADGDYTAAIGHYQKIVNNGVASGELFFNLGNAYYKMNENGRAILYYEKANAYLEGDEALQKNLTLARMKIVDKIEPIPKLFLSEWWEWLVHIFGLNSLAWITLSAFILLIIVVANYLYFSRRFLRSLAYVLGIITALFFIMFISRIYEFETQKFGIILDKTTAVTSEPESSSTEMFVIHEGTKVKLLRTLDQWVEISLVDGKTGWCKLSSLQTI